MKSIYMMPLRATIYYIYLIMTPIILSIIILLGILYNSVFFIIAIVLAIGLIIPEFIIFIKKLFTVKMFYNEEYFVVKKKIYYWTNIKGAVIVDSENTGYYPGKLILLSEQKTSDELQDLNKSFSHLIKEDLCFEYNKKIYSILSNHLISSLLTK